MKKFFLVLAIGFSFIVFGCATTPKLSKQQARKLQMEKMKEEEASKMANCYNSLPEWIRNGKKESDTYVFAVGVSPYIKNNMALMRDEAASDAKAKLAGYIKTHIMKTVESSLKAAVSANSNEEISELRAIRKEIVNQTVSGAKILKTYMSTCGDGDFYALVGVKKSSLLQAMKSKYDNSGNLKVNMQSLNHDITTLENSIKKDEE